MRLERKDKKKELVTNISVNKCRCKSRQERRDEGTSGEVERDTVFRLKGNEGKGQEITAGCGEKVKDCREMS